MPKQRQSVPIVAPGSFGINTEDSPAELPLTFAAKADNCVIDKSGRLAARKGLLLSTVDKTLLGSSNGIISCLTHKNDAGTVGTFSAGNSKLFRGTDTLVDVSPTAYTINADNWKFESFNDDIWAFQRGQAPLKYDEGGTNKFVAIGGSAPEANEVLGAAGRLWAMDVSGNSTVIYWSALLDGTNWTTGDSGSIDLDLVWPAGYDQGVGLAFFNNLLVIFGKKSIVLYQGAADPSTMSLRDTVNGVGLVSRDSKVDIGTDLIFLSNDGLRSLGRTVANDGSQPLSDVAKQLRTDLIATIASQADCGCIRMAHNRKENIFLLIFQGQGITYCFDTKQILPSGDFRATRWFIDALCANTDISEEFYIGTSEGICTYSGYQDFQSDYNMVYLSNPSDLGAPDVNKILKKIKPVIIGNQTTNVVLKWGYGYGSSYSSEVVTLSTGTGSLYGVALFNSGEFYTGGTVINTPSVYTDGAGDIVSVGLEAVINGNPLSLQEMNMQLITGRTL
jgi:hypothetical protein